MIIHANIGHNKEHREVYTFAKNSRMNEKSDIDLNSDFSASGLREKSSPHEVRVFLCYRRNDGAWYAEWLNENLSEVEYTDSDGNLCCVRTYYDKTAPGVADWKQLHFPSLQASQALVLICTPGMAKDLSKRGHPDWVYEELSWWIQHRQTSPIVIDATGEGDRWLPEMIARKWPNINRIDLDKGQAEAGTADENAGFSNRIRERVIGAIRQSERATVFEDLERLRKLNQRLKWALLGIAIVSFLAAIAGFEVYRFSQQAETERQIAVARLAITQAEIIRNEEPDKIELSVLLALEAYKRTKSSEAERSLRASLNLLPRHHTRMEHGKNGLIIRMIFSPDGKYLASSARDYTARLWNVETGKELFVSKNKDVVLGLAFSRDGGYIATGSGDLYCEPVITTDTSSLSPKDCIARVLRVPTGEVVATFTQESSVLSVAFSPDGRLLVTGGCDRTARLWDIQAHKELARLFHGDAVDEVTFSPDGKYVATSCRDGYARIWSVPTGKMLVQMPHGEWVESVAFSPDGKYLATGTVGNTAYLWSVPNGEIVVSMVHNDRAHAVTFSPNGQFLATISYDMTALIWEVPQGRVAARFLLDAEGYDAAFSSDSKYLAIGSGDSLGRVWDWKANKEVTRIVNNQGFVARVAFSPDGRYLATGSSEEDHSVRLWELPYNTTLSSDRLEEEACSRLRRNLTMREWQQTFGSESYRMECPGLQQGQEKHPETQKGVNTN
jgi:WD40 repeat protein